MNPAITRSILPTTVFLLLSVLVLPGTSQAYSAKDAYLADTILSAVDLQQGAANGFGGDYEHSVTTCEITLRAPKQGALFLSIPAPAPEFSHSVSQARAPPPSHIS